LATTPYHIEEAVIEFPYFIRSRHDHSDFEGGLLPESLTRTQPVHPMGQSSNSPPAAFERPSIKVPPRSQTQQTMENHSHDSETDDLQVLEVRSVRLVLPEAPPGSSGSEVKRMSSRYLIRFGYDTLVRYVNRKQAAFTRIHAENCPTQPTLIPNSQATTPAILQWYSKTAMTRAYRLLHSARNFR
jgi:hypothetical protein